ncbi:MAG: phosphoribosyltransferase [Muribaculaceae bacterium]|nr:phosphoribosyltransferase [Muribaculaceae bacterium]
MTDERTAIDMKGILSELTFPKVDEGSLVVSTGDKQSRAQPKDLFAVNKRKSWDKTVEARCDFTYKLSLTRRSDVNFISIWKKSIYGRTLTDIKGDSEMVTFFAESITPVISETLGYHLADGSWAVCTSPKRRHKEKNFATLISERIADSLGIPFYEDVALCHSKQRVNAVFELNNLPKESNIIVFDDFVTTGMTLAGMKKLLSSFGKNGVYFSCINNKL